MINPNQGSGVKIQINSLAALERLLGDDAKMEIEVRQSVVEAFARGFVKNIANADAVAKVIEDLKDFVKREVVEETSNQMAMAGIVKDGSWYQTKLKLTDTAEEKIASEVRIQVYDNIRKAISEMNIDEIVTRYVTDAIRREVNHQVKAITQSTVMASLQLAMDQALDTDPVDNED